jgi:HAD superfamily hydrolase (TIGR01509 family)
MMPGLVEVLEAIEKAGIPKAIATSSSRRLATETLNTFALIPRFEFVITGDDVVRGKPDPEIYLAAAERLRLQPAEIMVLEDSVNGSLAASRAGMFTVAIPSRPAANGDFDHANAILTALSAAFIEQSFGLAR